MSQYWSALSGTALVLNPKEVPTFEKKYLAETFNKSGVTLEDIQKLESSGISETPFLRSGCRDEMLQNFPTFESFLELDAEVMPKNIFDIMLYDNSEYSGGIFINSTSDKFEDVLDGSFIIFADKSTCPSDILIKKTYTSYNELITEFKEKMSVYLPKNFEWETHIGFFQCAAFA